MQEVQGETVRGDEIEERDPDVFDLFEEVDHARADGYFLHVIGGLDVRQDFLIGIDAEECGEDEREGGEDFDMLGDEREDQVPVHGVEHAEQVCGKEESVVVELEWQGSKDYARMGMDGIEQVVYYLLKTYPQLDASRVYTEGLSAGSATSTGLGIRKSYLFAAVGGFSAGILPGSYRFDCDRQSLLGEAIQKSGAVEMPYFSATGTSDTVVPFINKDNWQKNAFFAAWQIYQIMNGMSVTERPDFSKDTIFGITLENRETIWTNKGISMETGVLSKNGVPLIQMVAVNDYGHWNFKPAAKMMWDYFMQFSRDPQTKELIYHGRK